MIRSMTGFGRAEASDARLVVGVEARSVNHRHLEIAIRLPRALSSLEMDARRLVQSRLERGRVDVSVQLSPVPGAPLQQIRVDHALARAWVSEARDLREALGLASDVSLTWILERPGVVRVEEVDAEASPAWPTVAQALSGALDDLVGRRTAEGEALAAELRALHASLVSHGGAGGRAAPRRPGPAHGAVARTDAGPPGRHARRRGPSGHGGGGVGRAHRHQRGAGAPPRAPRPVRC